MGSVRCTQLIIVLLSCFAADLNAEHIVCNYETKSHLREGQGKFDLNFLEPALKFCTHLNYGYAAIKDEDLKLVPSNEQFDTIKDNYRKVTNLKRDHPKLKVLLSVGGNEDISGEGTERNIKYMEVLESSAKRLAFINSAHTLIKAYGFDGIDLAWEFPETKPKKIKTGIKKLWSSFKKTIGAESVMDDKEEEHRNQFSALVRELKNAFQADNLLVTLTVLPNVNSTVYYNPRELAPHLDYIVLQAFDFYTPERNPKIADFPAPLYELIDRRPDENVDAWVKYWTTNGAPANKLILGIPTYGRTWKLDSDSKIDGVPPLNLDGAGEAGPFTKDAGILSYPEICNIINSPENSKKPAALQYKKVPDATKRHGIYAYRLPDSDDKGGIWIAYEDPESAANKAAYAKAKGLGGVGVDDLTLDDFRGSCNRDEYAILRAVSSRL